MRSRRVEEDALKATTPFIYLLRAYRIFISPFLPNVCRFHPSCSRYAMEALERHGLLRGSILTIGRLIRCRPLGGWGDDPVPE